MNQQSFGQKLGNAVRSRSGATSGNGATTGQQRDGRGKPGTTNQAVLGPFTLRDLAVFAATLILLVASLLPVFFGRFNLWNAGSLFFLGLGIVLPMIVTALFAARRFAPATKIRIGSLSVDQFASVVASFALAFFFVSAAAAFSRSLLVGLVGSVLLFAATVLGRFIPYFAGDFLGRGEAPAHVVARDAAVPLPKPHAPKESKPGEANRVATPQGVSPDAPTSGGEPSLATHTADVVPSRSGPSSGSAAAERSAAQETVAGEVPVAAATPRQPAAEPAATAVHQQVLPQQASKAEPIGATVDPASRPEESDQPVHEAFWFAVAQHRTAVDPQTGASAFVIEPGGWVLALEDRGHEFLVQHTDGRLGVLRDLSNIERG